MRNSNKSKGKGPLQSKSVPAASAGSQSRNKRKRADVLEETKSTITAAAGPGKGKIITREKGVADFWLSAMKINVALSNKVLRLDDLYVHFPLQDVDCEVTICFFVIPSHQITKRDEGALKYVKDIKTRKLEKEMGFVLEFVFDANPYFKNSSLEKTYYLRNHDKNITRPYLAGKKNTSRPLLKKTTGTKIEWHQNKNLKRTLVMTNNRSGRNAKSQPASPPQYKRAKTFFNFFNPQTFRLMDDDAVMEESAHVDNEEVKKNMEEELDLGLSFHDRIIPHFTSWFTGKAAKGHEFEVQDESCEDNADAVEEEDEFGYVEYLDEGFETEYTDEDSDTANKKLRYKIYDYEYVL